MIGADPAYADEHARGDPVRARSLATGSRSHGPVRPGSAWSARARPPRPKRRRPSRRARSAIRSRRASTPPCRWTDRSAIRSSRVRWRPTRRASRSRSRTVPTPPRSSGRPDLSERRAARRRSSPGGRPRRPRHRQRRRPGMSRSALSRARRLLADRSRVTVPLSAFATQIAPAPAATPTGSCPTAICWTTLIGGDADPREAVIEGIGDPRVA